MTIKVIIKNDDDRPNEAITAETYYQPKDAGEKSRKIGSVFIHPGESKTLYVSHDTHIVIFEGATATDEMP